MAQEINWEREYRGPLFVTKKAEPQNDTLRFFKFVKKQKDIEIEGLKILDLGCGTGRNSNYLAGLGNEVVGLEISETALKLAEARAKEMGVKVAYLHQSMGEKYPLGDGFFDVALDITSSNALNENERKIYLAETARTLREGGLLFVRALCKDGDKNAKKLLKFSPGREFDTYVMPKSGLVERVFAEADFRAMYGESFKILKLDKKSGYTNFDGQPYKRNYFLAYLEKK